MEGKKVYFFEVDPVEQEYFTHVLEHKAELHFSPKRLTYDNIAEAAPADYIVSFIYSDLSQRSLEQLRNLKGIVTMSVGIDHIDTDEAARRGINISNVPAYGPNTVAEHTIALLLAMSRNIVPSVERTRAEIYDYTGLTGWDLMGRTIGIVGTGKIGAHVAKIAWGLGMKIIAYDPKPNQSLLDHFGIQYVSLEDLLKNADVITLHVPGSKENRHFIGTPQFAMMKRGVVILNTARGTLIDPQALISALDQGIVFQAGIDVLEEEGLLKEEKQFFSKYFDMKSYQTALANHELMRNPRVLVTPHNAFNSREALSNILQTTAQNVEGMLTNDFVNVAGK